jgi:hypothetical protein
MVRVSEFAMIGIDRPRGVIPQNQEIGTVRSHYYSEDASIGRPNRERRAEGCEIGPPSARFALDRQSAEEVTRIFGNRGAYDLRCAGSSYLAACFLEKLPTERFLYSRFYLATISYIWRKSCGLPHRRKISNS